MKFNTYNSKLNFISEKQWNSFVALAQIDPNVYELEV